MISDNNKRFLITIDKDLYKKLEEVAASVNRSVSNYIINLIKEDLKGK